MSISVGELVRTNVHGTFHSDVQLTSYYDPDRNLQLARSYIFTSSRQGSQLGSVELLQLVRESFVDSTRPNRFLVLATYGHGKSHFAVALANFFGKPLESDEFRAIYAQLGHTLGDQPVLQHFKIFKEVHKPSLVILMRGDEPPQDLSSKFYQALERALAAHPATQGIRPPFWFDQAAAFLNRVIQERHKAADSFLRLYDLDLLSLIDLVEQRKDSAYEPCRQLFRHLYGVPPAFEGTTSLREMVEWIADQLCGGERPFGSALILFDEFSTFVQNYAGGWGIGAGAPLQDLLNGVDSCRGKVAVVAFAQHDPRTLVERSLAPETQVLGIVKELDRLDQVYTLKAVLEDVLDSYLQQDTSLWSQVMAEPTFRQQLKRAADLTRRIFGKRYDEELKWSAERFDATVAQGCFPLHPATTALFSTITFRATEQPRSVLQFAIGCRDKRASEPVIDNGRPNWALPTELVEYFKEMIGGRFWDDYQAAISEVGPDADPSLRHVLGAVLLILVGDVPTRTVGVDKIVAEFCGLEPSQAKAALEELERRHVLRYERADDRYTFWGAGGPAKVETALRAKLEHLSFTEPAANMVAEQLRRHGVLHQIAVSVPWGSPQDWVATQILIPRAHLTRSFLTQQAQGLVARPGEPREARGLVAWLLAETQNDLAWYRDTAPRLLDEALREVGYPELPIVLMLPRRPIPGTLDLARSIHGLLTFAPHQVQDAGPDAYNALLKSYVEQLSKLVQQLRTESDPIVPEPFRSLPRLNEAPSVESLVEAVFKRAFERGPGEFFIQYRSSSTRFVDAVKVVASHLATDSMLTAAPTLRNSNPIAHDLVEKYLRSDKWCLLGSRLGIQVPSTNSRLWHGWQFLEERVPRGAAGVQLQPVLTTLLNPPYGFDSQTLTLLFTAWYGYYRYELELSVDGRIRELTEVMQDNRRGGLLKPADFLTALRRATLTRTNPSETDEAIRQIIERIERVQPASRAETENELALIQKALQDPRIDSARRVQLGKAQSQLQGDLERANTYEKQARELVSLATSGDELEPVLKGVAAVSELGEPPRLVMVEGPTPAELAQHLRARADELLRVECERLAKLTRLDAYDQHRKRAKELKFLLAKYGLPGRVNSVMEAEKRLERERDRLHAAEQARKHDEAIRDELRTMTVGPSLDLATYRRYLQRLDALAPRTEQVRDELVAKRREIEQQAELLTAFVAELVPRVDRANTLEEVGAIRDEVLRRQLLYQGTDEAATLDQVLTRCEVLERVFTEAERLRTSPLTHASDVRDRQRSLEALLSESDAHLSDIQRVAIASVRDTIEQRAAEMTQRAIRWLDDMEQELEQTRQFYHLREQLRQPPAFLPLDEHPRLERLRQRVQEALEQDAEQQVEFYFRQIRDPDKRSRLLARLQSMVEDLSRS
ncbi:MAG: hypothetical protein QJR03_10315 [Sphaerobacter sp.]|nr:hypothetical protein [Sphaerobacter sp.]